ncbi:hypothetical protein EVAR_75921_1 [Eumeta japonica]|uniref:Mos1 transposase HTH domain-containing protein n=1 Tax=Eumeta variegata TaxID=151549 RepID=A0A4C1UW91_EUMVA|nr:hypothetical protein EVAR_75921_1 [Eumeta japonica]
MSGALWRSRSLPRLESREAAELGSTAELELRPRAGPGPGTRLPLQWIKIDRILTSWFLRFPLWFKSTRDCRRLDSAYGDEAQYRNSVHSWFTAFAGRRDHLFDDSHEGRPVAAVIETHVRQLTETDEKLLVNKAIRFPWVRSWRLSCFTNNHISFRASWSVSGSLKLASSVYRYNEKVEPDVSVRWRTVSGIGIESRSGNRIECQDRNQNGEGPGSKLRLGSIAFLSCTRTSGAAFPFLGEITFHAERYRRIARRRPTSMINVRRACVERVPAQNKHNRTRVTGKAPSSRRPERNARTMRYQFSTVTKSRAGGARYGSGAGRGRARAHCPRRPRAAFDRTAATAG